MKEVLELPAEPGVYIIQNSVTGCRYVGSSVNVKKRLGEHLSSLRNGKHCNRHLQSAFTKYGEDVFEFQVLEKTATLLEREQYYIDTLKPGYNILSQAGRVTGYKHSEETRKKLRESHLGLKPSVRAVEAARARAIGNTYSLGRKWSPEERERRTVARLNRPNPMKNKKHSAEIRKKMSDNRPKCAIERVSADGDTRYYPSIISARKDGFHTGHISECCRGQRALYRGYGWRYVK